MVRNIGYLQNRISSVNHWYAEVQLGMNCLVQQLIGVKGKDNAGDVIKHYSGLESSLTFTVQREQKESSLMSYRLDRRGEVDGGWLAAARSTTRVQTFKVCLETNDIVIEAIDHEGDIS